MKRVKLIEDVPGYKKDTIYTWDGFHYIPEDPELHSVRDRLPDNWVKQYPNWFQELPAEKE